MFKIIKVAYILLVLLAITGQKLKVEAAENVSTTSEMSTPTSKTIESQVREFFVDIPVMIEIARCESNFRHSMIADWY